MHQLLAGHCSPSAPAQACAAKKSISKRLGQQFESAGLPTSRGYSPDRRQRGGFYSSPAQRPARIVRHVPEHLAQLLAPVTASGQSEIREERARLRDGGNVASVPSRITSSPPRTLISSTARSFQRFGGKVRRSARLAINYAVNHASTATFHAGSHAGAHGRRRIIGPRGPPEASP